MGESAQITTSRGCTLQECVITQQDGNTIECINCGREVHIKCTRLPLYQLSLFLGKNYRKYKCESCVVVPDNIKNMFKEISNGENASMIETAELRVKVSELEKEIKEQERKFNEAGNPDYDFQTKIENTIADNFKHIEEKLITKIDEMLPPNQSNQTYASVTSTSNGSCEQLSREETATNFRAIIREAKEAEQAEDLEQRRRVCNVILHGVPEKYIDNEKQKDENEKYIAFLFETLDLFALYRSFNRIGVKGDRARPIRLILRNDHEKDSLMGRLQNLKDMRDLKLSITDDYTPSQRKVIKEWI